MEDDVGWHMGDLLNTTHAIQDKGPPTDNDINTMMEEIKTWWFGDESDPPVEPTEMIQYATAKFGMSMSEFTFNDLQKKQEEAHKTIINLKNFIKNSGLHDDICMLEDMQRLALCMKHAQDLLFNSALLFHRIDPSRDVRLDERYNVETIISYNVDKCTSFQKLILHFLRILEASEYRKFKDECWYQIKTIDGYETGAWTKACDIKTFLYKNVQKEIDFEQWQNLTNPKDNGDHIVKHLVDSEQYEFASLSINRHQWSYDNGIFLVNTDTFWKYEEQDLWLQQAAAIQTYRRNNDWGQDYVVTPPDNKQMSVQYFDQPFRFTTTPEADANFNPHDIVVPELEQILSSQGLDETTQIWVLVMLARLFFHIGEMDKWQVVFFIKGVAGSGKSTLAQLIRYMYPSQLISTLNSNIEAKFGLSAIYEGLVCICAEVRADFGLNQADWQSAASGEEVMIAIKGKTGIAHKWTTPMFFLGNEMPKYENASGSVSRRIFLIEFNTKILNSDPQLFDKMIGNIDLFHRKAVSLYLQYVRKYGQSDIWHNNMPLGPQIWKYRERMRISVDPLYQFLTSNDMFEFGGREWSIKKNDLSNQYMEFRNKAGLGKISFNVDHFGSTFADLNIKEERGYFTGIRMKEDN